jgi:hypothetical protein
MRGRTVWMTALLLGVATFVGAGCAGTKNHRPIARAEPPLDVTAGDAPLVADAPQARPADFADRHPLLATPRDIYQNVNRGPITKAAAATIVGVPAGLFGEMKQIVVGTPRSGY